MSVLLGDQKFVHHENGKSIHPSSQSAKDIERAKEGITVSKWRYAKRYIRYFYQKLRLKYFIPLVVVAIYAFIGAGLFILAERRNSEIEKEEKAATIAQAKVDFVEQIRTIYRNNSLIQQQENLTQDLLINLLDSIGFSFDQTPGWDFWQSTYYAVTIFTTIGYGNICAVTIGGQVLTVFYAMVGIPLMLTALNGLGNFLFALILDVYNYLSNFAERLWNKQTVSVHPEKSVPPKEIPNNNGTHSDNPTTNDDFIVTIDPIEDENIEEKVKSIPVWVALVVTVGWIFLCAGIFLLFENWTFWQSTYFIFISLSTIGLGDLTPEKPVYMVALLFLVVVGLSLVSMCISVIQTRLEELYIQLLMKILSEYQKRLAQGLDETGATQGMVDAWANNKTAKYLLPLLSNSKMQAAVGKFEKKAKDRGIVIPPILKAIDFESGIPAILNVKKESDEDILPHQTLVERIAEANRDFGSQPELSAITEGTSIDIKLLQSTIICCDTEQQTDDTFVDHNFTQTHTNAIEESTVQTNISSFGVKDDKTETDCVEHCNNDAQTIIITQHDDCVQTLMALLSEAKSQTDNVNFKDESVQTQPTIITTQRDDCVQTLIALLSQAETQTATLHFKDKYAQTHSVVKEPAGDKRKSAVPISSDLNKHMFDAEKSIPTDIVTPKTGQRKKAISSIPPDQKSISTKDTGDDKIVTTLENSPVFSYASVVQKTGLPTKSAMVSHKSTGKVGNVSQECTERIRKSPENRSAISYASAVKTAKS